MIYNTKVIYSGNRIEIYKSIGYSIENEEKHIKNTSNFKNVRKCNEKRRVNTLTDARNNIIRLYMCNTDMSTFITLTFSCIEDYKDSKKSINIFFTKLRKDYHSLKYIWVLEYGDKNGRLHYHLLCNV